MRPITRLALAAAAAAVLAGVGTAHAAAPPPPPLLQLFAGDTVFGPAPDFLPYACVAVHPAEGNHAAALRCTAWDVATQNFDGASFVGCVVTQPDCLTVPARTGATDSAANLAAAGAHPQSSVAANPNPAVAPNPNPGSVNPDGTVILRPGGPR